jgi:N-hydroxyarylamine O-acetyltransferase
MRDNTIMSIDMLVERIDYSAALRPDLATLRGLYRAWQAQVPYENLDVELDRPISVESTALTDKIGRRRRGGMCLEMNCAFAFLLRGVGFEVTLVEAIIMRAVYGDGMVWGGHNALLVDVDGTSWLVDIGLSDPFLEPMPLYEGTHHQGPFAYRLERLDADSWRAHHHPQGIVSSLDFRTTPREPADFAERADRHHRQRLRSGLLVVNRYRAGYERSLRARTLARASPDGVQKCTLSSIEEFAAALAAEFDVPLDDIGVDGLQTLWSNSGVQHEEWLTRQAQVT